MQVKENNGNWTPWLTDTTRTEARFVGTVGYSYTFQVQATDNVGNVSNWAVSAPATVQAVTKYYTFGDQRVAMRRGDEVYYLHGDHLGSVSLTTDTEGAVVSEGRYLPYGEERWTVGSSPYFSASAMNSSTKVSCIFGGIPSIAPLIFTEKPPIILRRDAV